MATEATNNEHVGYERMEAEDATVIESVAAIVASPSTAQLKDHK